MPKPNILYISDLFPNKIKPAFGIFVERQAYYLKDYCNITVVAPVRIFPPLKIFKSIAHPRKTRQMWKHWQSDLANIPANDIFNGLPVYYPRYTSPPRQGLHATWGFFAYPFVHQIIKTLHLKQDFKLIHAHYATPAGIIALLAKRWMKIPVILSIHGSDIHYTAPQNQLAAHIIRWVFQNADLLIANSNWTKRKVIEYGGDPKKIEIVRLGGNSEVKPILQNNSSHDKNEVITLLSVGYLTRSKGHSYVLRAIKNLVTQGSNIRYVIVGNGDEQEYLESLARELEITHLVSFEGYKPHSEVWPYYATCDIFVLPSWVEGFGIVYIEALSLGKPVIGCEQAGGPEDLRELGDCIELVKPRDVESLTATLKRLIDNPESRVQLGNKGREIVEKYFTWEKNAINTFEIYQKVLNHPSITFRNRHNDF